MANVPQMIREAVQRKRVQQYIVEKDYAISYLMAAIATTEGLGENLVLKGGTALKKVYFSEYRFSEDIDYSTCTPVPIANADTLMQNAVQNMAGRLNVQGPFLVDHEPLVLKSPHPGGQKAYIVRVQFPGQRQPLCRLKVEITVDEPIIAPIEHRSILHNYPEEFRQEVPVYSLQEIATEKMRTLLQVRERLQKKGWGASRLCRDYYDLWHLLQLPLIRDANLLTMLEKKCKLRSVTFLSPRDFIAEELFEVVRSEWDQQLLPFIPEAPPVDTILSDVQAMFLARIW